MNKFKQELEDKKELEKLKQEESKYPKGTRLLSEEERIATLDSLNLKKKKVGRGIIQDANNYENDEFTK